ncbi:MAG: glycosyltransferase, partial [candidate division WOR-3 bacterium]
MKIAFNAIRVSNKAGSGFDTFIINFVNEFAKYVYENPQLNISFDVFTLYPQHFPEVKKENIKQVKLPFLKQKVVNLQSIKKNNVPVKNKLFFSYLLTPIYYQLSTTYFTFADYFRMFWTQFVFPFYAKNYDITVALTEYEVGVFVKNQILIIHNTVPFLFPHYPSKYRFYTYKILPKIIREKCKKIITVSNILKRELTNIFGINLENIEVIYEGINTNSFRVADSYKIENL